MTPTRKTTARKTPVRQSASLLLAAALVAAALPCQPPPAAGSQDPEAETQAPKPATPMPVPRSLLKRRGDHTIVVDGALQDWPAAPPLQLDDARQLSGTALGAWRGPRDLAARAFLLWDDQHLYVAAVVRDDWHRPLTKDSPRLYEIPPADSLVLSFDPQRDTRSLGRDPGREEDREFWLAEVEGQGRQVVQWDRLRGTARYAEGAVVAVVRDRDRGLTTYEARLPWSEILPPGQRPARGRVLDLQVTVNDYDEATDPMPQTRVGWTFGTGPRIDPGLLGSVMLVDVLEEQVESLPEFPPAPAQTGDPVPGQAYWVRFLERLQATPPVAVRAASETPELVGGADRLARLEELENHVATFPRVDFLEYHHRVHRRMRREVGGLVATGLPFFWDHALRDVARRAAAAEDDGTRVYKLPLSGWLVTSPEADFAIDPSGDGVARELWDLLDFVLFTSPRDPTKRSDQLLLRMASAKRAVMMHQTVHVPGVQSSAEALIEPGKKYDIGDLQVHALGVSQDGLVSATIGYAIRWPDGLVLVHSGAVATSDMVRAAVGEQPVDLLLLSALHPAAKALAHRLAPRLSAVDDAFLCTRFAGPGGRVPLADVFALQAQLRPHASILLAPGESMVLPETAGK